MLRQAGERVLGSPVQRITDMVDYSNGHIKFDYVSECRDARLERQW
jgi:hypothetical protein